MSDDGDRRNRPWRPGLDLAEYVDGLMEKHKRRSKSHEIKLQAYKARFPSHDRKVLILFHSYNNSSIVLFFLSSQPSFICL